MRCLSLRRSYSFRRTRRGGMESRRAAVSEAGQLTQVREDSDVLSNCFLPPIVRPSSAREPGEGEADRQEVMHGAKSSPAQQKPEEKRSLLDELARTEADLREGLQAEAEQQREAEFLRRQDNSLQRTHLCHLSLSQRVAKPWVNSYFRRFPMHIYCLPVQAAHHRARRGARTKRK